MKKRLTVLDPGFLIVLVVCLLAIWSFLSREGLPQLTDAELHIFRLAELSRLIRAGEFFPRWAPNFYYGYGYPIFNFYAPLTYYLGLAIDFMPVLGPVAAVKGMFMLGLLGAGLGMYGYVKGLWGRAAGLVAAAAYVYTPYILYIDPHARGDLAEAFSFAVFPLALWSMDRLRRVPTSWNWISSSLLVAAIIMTHNLMAMVFIGLLFGWTVWQEIIRGIEFNDRDFTGAIDRLLRFRLFLVLIAGVGVAAVFWLVVALEQDTVNLSSLIGDGGHFDFRNHFVELGELLTGSKLIDWGATEPEYVMNLGHPHWLLGLIGILAIISGRSRDKKQGVFFIVSGAFLLFLMVSISIPVWDAVPLLPFLQFPWRLLGAMGAMLAILAGIGIGTLVDALSKKIGLWIPAIVIAIIMLLALPLIQVPPWPPDFGPTTARQVLAEELAGRWLGTTSTADFVPATVDIVPQPQESLIGDILNGRPIDRVNRVTLPQGTNVTFENVTPLHTIYRTESDQDFVLRLFLFDFPGWETRIDGAIVNTELGRPEGFIVIPVQAGTHEVEVKFTDTPVRTLAWIVSLASLAFVLLIAWLMRPNKGAGADRSHGANRHYSKIDNLFLWPILAVSLIILVLNIAVVQPSGLLHHEFKGEVVQGATDEAFVNFGGQIALIGYDLPKKSVKHGENLQITAYWKLMSDPLTNYQVFVHLFNDDGQLVAQSDKLNPGDYPARRWPTDKYVRDEHNLALPSDLPPGEYMVSVGLWVADEGWRLPLMDANDDTIGDAYSIVEPIYVE